MKPASFGRRQRAWHPVPMALVLLLLAGMLAMSAGSAGSSRSLHTLEHLLTHVRRQHPLVVVNATDFEVVAVHEKTTLYRVVTTPEAYNDVPLMLIDLRGDTPFDIGYAYGRLLAAEIAKTFDVFMDYAIPSFVERSVAIDFFAFQFDGFLAKHTPAAFIEELKGFEKAGSDLGHPRIGKMMRAMIALANGPGDSRQWWTILDEEIRRAVDGPFDIHTFGCDYFAVWGADRTTDGHVLSSRNLDWLSKTGIDAGKLIAVYNGSYATVGYAGLDIALAGMNSRGVTAHQMNLMNSAVTFEGLPWGLRLRMVLDQATTIEDAARIIGDTANSVSVNLGITSASSGRGIAVETVSNRTTFFADNDPRELASSYGRPLKDAVFRSNHVYDPIIRLTETCNVTLGSDTEVRYLLQSTLIEQFSAVGKIDFPDALEIASAVGCASAANVMSIAFHPDALELYAAWEQLTERPAADSSDGADKWTPACQSPYIHLDLSKFLNNP